MAFLITRAPDGKEEQFTLFKRLTSIGSGPEADIRINDEALDSIAAYISQSANGFTLIVPPEKTRAIINNVPVNRYDLVDGAQFRLSTTSWRFLTHLVTVNQNDSSQISAEVIAYKRMLNFSQRIAQEKDIEALLGTLLKEITLLTGAEHGFLVLVEEGRPRIKVREPSDHNGGAELINPMSDSVVRKVIEKKQAIVISDALNDHEFSSSLSVINYRLTSVMCTPLTYQGHTFGAIYVGNNSFINAFDKKSLEIMTIYSSQAAVLVQNALYINALKRRTQKLQESLELTKFGGLIGGCFGMQAVFQQVEKVAKTDINVLIVGEMGTGKELIARELHNRSDRKHGPFLVLNCGAIAEDFLDSELFGHVRGAFSGAITSRIGKLQSAHNGTLFLDEIGEMPPRLQAKLFNALKDNQITKLGDHRKEDINTRVVAASAIDLKSLVDSNQFRKDLYYRLNVVQLNVPPLKERGNDVLVIANFFLYKYAKIYGKEVIGIDEEAQNALLNYEWPGNVRQLEDRMRKAVVMCDSHRITMADLDIKPDTASGVLPPSDALEQFRSRYIAESLERNAGNRTKTANELGVDPRTIFRYLESAKKQQTADNV